MGCLKLSYYPQMRVVRGREPAPSREKNNAQWWFTPDPLAEKYYHISPYAYVLNNPIRYIDPAQDFAEFSPYNYLAVAVRLPGIALIDIVVVPSKLPG